MLYTVEKGRHDFKPNDQDFCTFRSKVEGAFWMDDSMWFSQSDPDYQGGEDVKDWNKIAGVTWFFTGNTNRSAMLAWRPVESEKGLFEVAAYVNPASGKFQATVIGTVKVDELIEFQVIWVADMAVFKIRKPGGEDWTWAELPLRRPPWGLKIYRHLGAWFGGNRPAHKRMEFWMETKYTVL